MKKKPFVEREDPTETDKPAKKNGRPFPKKAVKKRPVKPAKPC